VSLYAACSDEQSDAAAHAVWLLQSVSSTSSPNYLDIDTLSMVDYGCGAGSTTGGYLSLYLAIYGETSAAYSIILSQLDDGTAGEAGSVKSLNLNQAASGNVDFKAFDYYSFKPSTTYQGE
jgi:hypothetical protein